MAARALGVGSSALCPHGTCCMAVGRVSQSRAYMNTCSVPNRRFTEAGRCRKELADRHSCLECTSPVAMEHREQCECAVRGAGFAEAHQLPQRRAAVAALSSRTLLRLSSCGDPHVAMLSRLGCSVVACVRDGTAPTVNVYVHARRSHTTSLTHGCQSRSRTRPCPGSANRPPPPPPPPCGRAVPRSGHAKCGWWKVTCPARMDRGRRQSRW